MLSIDSQKIFRWCLLGLVVLILLGPLPPWLTGVGQSAVHLSARVERGPDGRLANSPKAEALHSLNLPMRLGRMIVYPLLLLLFQLSGRALALRRWLERRTVRPGSNGRAGRFLARIWPERLAGQELLVILLFVLALNLFLFLLYLPLNYYRGFILAHQFGLSTQTAWGWLNDWLKSVLITLPLDGLLWTGFYGLIRLFPGRWPIPGGALLLLFSLVIVLLTPILITPLFFQVRPLDDPALQDRILTLAGRAGIEVDELYVIEASAKTTAANAYVTGFGQARRIVLYDTLLNGYSADEIELVLAHEMGHWYYRHVWWSVLGLGAASWLGLFGLRWLLQRSWRPLGLRGPADVAGLPYVLAVVFIAASLSLPVQNAISRSGEAQADRFALAISQKPAAFISLFERFPEQNLGLVDPPHWEKLIFYTHPSTADRMRLAETFQSRDSAAVGEK